MCDKPIISVLISSYNKSDWIDYCLNSLLNQKKINPNDYELIVIDDKSTDRSKQFLKKYSKIKQVQIIFNQKNLGLPRTLNKAIKKSRGNFLIRVDIDDTVNVHFLYEFVKAIKMKNVKAIACNYNIINQKNKILKKVFWSKHEIACGVMYSKLELNKVGNYNTKFKMREGHELRKRFEKIHKILILNKYLYNYRKYPNNRTNNKLELRKYDFKLNKKK